MRLMRRTHMYAPGTRRHIKAALRLGATVEEIMEVLKLYVVQAFQACNLGLPILAEEITRLSAMDNAISLVCGDLLHGRGSACGRLPRNKPSCVRKLIPASSTRELFPAVPGSDSVSSVPSNPSRSERHPTGTTLLP